MIFLFNPVLKSIPAAGQSEFLMASNIAELTLWPVGLLLLFNDSAVLVFGLAGVSLMPCSVSYIFQGTGSPFSNLVSRHMVVLARRFNGAMYALARQLNDCLTSLLPLLSGGVSMIVHVE